MADVMFAHSLPDRSLLSTEAKPPAERNYGTERRRLRPSSPSARMRCDADRVTSLEPQDRRALGRNRNGPRDRRQPQHDVLTKEKPMSETNKDIAVAFYKKALFEG